MNTRKFLSVQVTRHNGEVFENDLMLKESHLLVTLARENKHLKVSIDEMERENFRLTFGE